MEVDTASGELVSARTTLQKTAVNFFRNAAATAATATIAAAAATIATATATIEAATTTTTTTAATTTTTTTTAAAVAAAATSALRLPTALPLQTTSLSIGPLLTAIEATVTTERGLTTRYSSLEDGSLGPDWESHRTTLTLTACVALLIAVCGFAGNLLTILALTSNKGPSAKLRRKASNLFIVSLSLADLMFSAVNMPFAASRFFHREWVHGEFLCRLFPFFRYMNVGLSLLSITAITINRYILIGHRRFYDRIYHNNAIYLMIGFTWIFPIMVLVPTWFGRWGTFGYDPTILNCSILEVNGKSPKYFLFVSAFLVPCFTIIICYARIFCIVHQSKANIAAHARTTEQSREREVRRRLEEWKVTKMVLVIFCSFLVCYLPITLVKVADRTVRYPGVQLLAYTLVYLSACINPIIYGLTNQQYRDAYRYTISRLCGFAATGWTLPRWTTHCPFVRGGFRARQSSSDLGQQPRQQRHHQQKVEGSSDEDDDCNDARHQYKREATSTTSVSIQCPSVEHLEVIGLQECQTPACDAVVALEQNSVSAEPSSVEVEALTPIGATTATAEPSDLTGAPQQQPVDLEGDPPVTTTEATTTATTTTTTTITATTSTPNLLD